MSSLWEFNVRCLILAMIDPDRVSTAVELYNRVHQILIEAGWTESLTEKEKPTTWWWRHPNHPGAFAMDAAFTTIVQARPKRR